MCFLLLILHDPLLCTNIIKACEMSSKDVRSAITARNVDVSRGCFETSMEGTIVEERIKIQATKKGAGTDV